jgi:hypothetical protein
MFIRFYEPKARMLTQSAPNCRQANSVPVATREATPAGVVVRAGADR